MIDRVIELWPWWTVAAVFYTVVVGIWWYERRHENDKPSDQFSQELRMWEEQWRNDIF